MPSLWQVNNCFKVTSVSAIENGWFCPNSESFLLVSQRSPPPPLRLKVTLFPNSICPGIREQKYKLNPVLTHNSQRRERAQTVKTKRKRPFELISQLIFEQIKCSRPSKDYFSINSSVLPLNKKNFNLEHFFHKNLIN